MRFASIMGNLALNSLLKTLHYSSNIYLLFKRKSCVTSLITASVAFCFSHSISKNTAALINSISTNFFIVHRWVLSLRNLGQNQKIVKIMDFNVFLTSCLLKLKAL